jgi:hypothetical protein
MILLLSHYVPSTLAPTLAAITFLELLTPSLLGWRRGGSSGAGTSFDDAEESWDGENWF